MPVTVVFVPIPTGAPVAELGVAVETWLPELQRQAESLMVTPCTIARGCTVAPDPITGGDVLSQGTIVYQGGCKVQSHEGEPRSVEAGSATRATVRWEIHVPVSSGPYRLGDVVRATGRVFRVEAIHAKTWQTAQRLPVTEVMA